MNSPQLESPPSYTQLFKEEVTRQLERMLQDPLFRNSKRYPALLRHMVAKALEGDTDDLKERSIGHEIFGKSPDYDTNSENIVRITAREIRRRLAQYYQEAGHENELRIELYSGSYVPVFAPSRIRRDQELTDGPEQVEVGVPKKSPDLENTSSKRSIPSTRRVLTVKSLTSALTALTVLVALLLFVLQNRIKAVSSVKSIWSEAMANPGRILYCIPTWQANGEAVGVGKDPHQRINFGDAVTMTILVAQAQDTKKQFSILGAKDSTLADFREGPSVLIGSFDNEWTMRLVNPLRFYFPPQDNAADKGTSNSSHLRILDRQNKAFDGWRAEVTDAQTVTKDYVIIARYHDTITGQIVIVGAGLTLYGTEAAGEILTDPQYLENLVAKAPKSWNGTNLEAVYAIQVIGGKYGPPSMVAANFWN